VFGNSIINEKIGGHCFFVKKDGVTLENKGFERKIRVSDLTLPMKAGRYKNGKVQIICRL
jgi:hypothetical protein